MNNQRYIVLEVPVMTGAPMFQVCDCNTGTGSLPLHYWKEDAEKIATRLNHIEQRSTASKTDQ